MKRRGVRIERFFVKLKCILLILSIRNFLIPFFQFTLIGSMVPQCINLIGFNLFFAKKKVQKTISFKQKVSINS